MPFGINISNTPTYTLMDPATGVTISTTSPIHPTSAPRLATMPPTNKSVGAFPIKDKILLVTGGGSGIGLALAKHFHAKGARIVIGDLKLTAEAEAFLHSTEAGAAITSSSSNNNDQGEAKDSSSSITTTITTAITTTLTSTTTTTPTATVIFQRCDVTHWPDLRALISRSVQEFGAVPDIYCPCAGIFEPSWSNFWDDDDDSEKDSGGYATLRINTEHPVKLTRLAFRALVGAEKKGVVLLVSSIAGLAANYSTALYCISKHAVVSLARSLAPADEEEGIKVVCICPGIVMTPMWEEREDSVADVFRYKQAKAKSVTSSADAIATMMGRLVEEEQFGGGSVYVKSAQRDELVVEEHTVSRLGFERPRAALDKERGKPWKL